MVSAADLIRLNRGLQEAFGQQEVADLDHKRLPQTNGSVEKPKPKPSDQTTNVISGLLDLTLSPASSQIFDVRLAASQCLQAYLSGHPQIKQFFLRRAVDGYHSETPEPDNILSIVMQGTNAARGSDPYRQWFAAVLLLHLLYEDSETKSIAREVSEGNAEAGEDVVTCIQSLSAILVAAEQNGEDERVSLGLLMLLSAWMYEDPDSVNDFLGEGSNVQSIIQLVLRTDQTRSLVSGLCAFLLGIVYEFSTKDSPIPRETLHSILTSRLGREQYVDKMTRIREHPLVRNFEVLRQGSDPQIGGLPEVFFEKTFVEFLKDNFSRVLRAIDRAPGLEVPVMANGVQKGISRELVDSLKSQLEAANQTIQKLESDIVTLERKLGQEQADHRKAKESASVEVGRIRNINEALQRNHEEETSRQAQERERRTKQAQQSHDAAIKSLEAEWRRGKDEIEQSAARARVRYEAEIADQKATLARLRTELEKASKEHVQDLQIAHEDYTTKTTALENRLQRAEEGAEESKSRLTRLQTDLESKEDARKAAKAEVDDLLMVLGELEEKRASDKVHTILSFV